MKHYTSIKQSKKLLELGLNPESADMFYSYHYAYEDETGWEGYEDYPSGEPYANYSHNEGGWKKKGESLPCWSVGALLELIPNYGILNIGGKCNITFYSTPRISSRCTNAIEKMTLFDACYEMVVWLLENNYIKTD